MADWRTFTALAIVRDSRQPIHRALANHPVRSTVSRKNRSNLNQLAKRLGLG